MKTHSNPAKYRALSEPHADQDAANAALDRFYDLVQAAREECRIPDVQVLCIVRYRSDDREVEGASRLHLGDSLRALPMLAEAYGSEKRAHLDLLARLATKEAPRA